MTQEFVTLPREVVEQALAAMSLALSDVDWRKASPTQPVIHKAYNATRSALEQPRGEQEPVGFVRQIDIEQIAKTPSDWGAMFGRVMGFNTVPVYTRPQPRQPLTDEAVLGVAKSIEIQFDSERLNEQIDDILAFARAIEAAHNIK